MVGLVNTCSKQAKRRFVIHMNQARKNWSEDAAGDFVSADSVSCEHGRRKRHWSASSVNCVANSKNAVSSRIWRYPKSCWLVPRTVWVWNWNPLPTLQTRPQYLMKLLGGACAGQPLVLQVHSTTLINDLDICRTIWLFDIEDIAVVCRI